MIGTGETHSVREFCDLAFKILDMNYEDYVVLDERFLRPAEVDLLVADPRKASAKLKWEPEVKFQDLVEMMVAADLERLSKAKN